MKGLAQQHKRHLRKLAHNLRPVIIVGAGGLSDPVMAEIDLAIGTHELIKVRLNTPDREVRSKMVERVIAHTGAQLVQAIGHVVVLFRQRPTDSRIALPTLKGS